MDKDTQEFYLALNERAREIIFDPDYVPVLTPPEDKSPSSLIFAWGIEMRRIDWDLAAAFYEGDSKDENKAD